MQSFRSFEHSGWSERELCETYDATLGTVTTQCIGALLDAAHVQSGSRTLDIATGPGYVAGAALKRGAQPTGVDFSEAQVALARHRYPSISFQAGDAEALTFAGGSFDAVVNNFGMPHFPNPEVAMREAFRVLRHGGHFAFTVWDMPERAVGFGAVYTAIRAHGSLDVGLPVGPNFFLYSDPEACKRSLLAAGFVQPIVTVVPQVWRAPSSDAIFDTIMNGTVRAAATLKAQTPEALEMIRVALRETFSIYRRDAGYELPMPAVLASAVRARGD
jgi:ubiquinone/menaquinone biosynthesis C-methylase UbiE